MYWLNYASTYKSLNLRRRFEDTRRFLPGFPERELSTRRIFAQGISLKTVVEKLVTSMSTLHRSIYKSDLLVVDFDFKRWYKVIFYISKITCNYIVNLQFWKNIRCSNLFHISLTLVFSKENYLNNKAWTWTYLAANTVWEQRASLKLSIPEQNWN